MEEGMRRDYIMKGGIRGYSLRTSRSVNVITHVLERDCGGDSIEIIHLKGLIINQPGIVAAVGRIPGKLKLDGGISFRFPCPVFKVPNNLPRDPNARHKTLLEAYERSSEKNAFKQGFIRAYKQAQGLSSEEEDKQQHIMEQQHVTFVEVNLAMPLDACELYLNPESIPTHPIPIKQAPVECESVKYGYHIVTYETPCGTVRILGRECGDILEHTFLKGVIIVHPGFVVAAGGIPRDLRLKDGTSFWYPSLILKAPTILRTQEPRSKLCNDLYKRSREANQKILFEKCTKALLRLKQSKEDEHGFKQSEEEEHGMDMEFCTMMEVNVAYPQGKRI